MRSSSSVPLSAPLPAQRVPRSPVLAQPHLAALAARSVLAPLGRSSSCPGWQLRSRAAMRGRSLQRVLQPQLPSSAGA